MNRMIGIVGALWGAVGVVALLSFAIYRLAERAIEAFALGLTGVQWLLVATVCVFMAYSEGFRGFQQQFSPRTAARIRYLRDRPHVGRTLFAPVFAMGYFHSTRRTKIVAFGMLFGIVALVTLMRLVAQPWRGIVDTGVVVGLAWGVISLVVCTQQALSRDVYETSPQVPQTS